MKAIATHPHRSHPRASLGLLAATGLLVVLAGCDVIPPPTDDPTRFYVLSAAPGAGQQAAPAPGAVRIGLKAVRLEGYLKHIQIVVRTGANEVEFRDFRRWAEPLDAAVYRALRSRIMAAPGVAQVYAEPFPADQDRDYDVSVDVLRCEGEMTSSGKYVASLAAEVEVSTAGANPRVVARKLFTAPAAGWDGTNFDALAGLLSKDIASLALDVVADLPPKG